MQQLTTAEMAMKQKAVLLICTGGTISMIQDPKTGVLHPADIEQFKAYIPELFEYNIHIDMLPFTPLIDSSDVNPETWSKLAHIIYDNYNEYDGFVILHGTDTMAYSASALSFMLDNLSKPVVFTGSQLPMGVLRGDAKENLITAIEIAVAQDSNGKAIVPEVCIFFEDKLLRGNRTTKKDAERFEAFRSYNYPPLAIAGVHIKYNSSVIRYPQPDLPLRLRTRINRHVVILKLFPGISQQTVEAILNIPHLKAVVLETFGAGNAPSDEWLYETLQSAYNRGIIIVSKTQCSKGSVEMGRYQTSINLLKAGVISGYDITTEALTTKMMYLLGEEGDNIDTVRDLLRTSLCGEMSVEDN